MQGYTTSLGGQGETAQRPCTQDVEAVRACLLQAVRGAVEADHTQALAREVCPFPLSHTVPTLACLLQ